MSTNLPEVLFQAQSLIRAGRLVEAQRMLASFVRANPKSEQGWLLMSQALTDPRQQADCLQRVLNLNPFSTEARNRLAELNPGAAPSTLRPPVPPRPAPPPRSEPARPAASGPTPEQSYSMWPESYGVMAEAPASSGPGSFIERNQRSTAQPAAAKGMPRWAMPALIGGGVFLAVATLCAIVFVGSQLLAIEAVPTQAVSFAERSPTPPRTATQPALPTLPPQWTATPTIDPNVTPTPTITRTPTITPTFRPPNPTVMSEMDTIQKQVADVRGLSIQGEVSRFTLSHYNLDKTLEGLLIDPETRADLERERKVLSALGLIKPTYDLVKYALQGYSDGVGGFYLPWSKQLFVIGDKFTGVERYTFSHEYTHALTDQHFDIGGAGVYPRCLQDFQRCQAIRALVEGDATLAMDKWLDQYGRPKDYQDLYNYKPAYDRLPEEFSPPFFRLDAAFPYRQGYRFVLYLHRRGNWAEVNKAYQNWPQSTEQILHPEKYVAGEGPVAVNDPDLSGVLGPEWQLVERNSLGEWMTFLLLGWGADYDSQLDDDTAEAASAGWGGDTYQVYYNAGTDRTAHAVHWVWDAPKDATEFDKAMQRYLKELYRGGTVERSDGHCWSATGQISCIFISGKETLWITAPNEDLLNAMLAQFPNFP